MPSTQSVTFTLKRAAYSSTEKLYLLFLFFSPRLHSPVVVSMVKDGEHDKTQMVNKCTFNNNNNNNYNYDDDDDYYDGNTINSDLPMCLYSFSTEI